MGTPGHEAGDKNGPIPIGDQIVFAPLWSDVVLVPFAFRTSGDSRNAQTEKFENKYDNLPG